VTTLRSGSASDVGKVRTTNQDVALEEPNLFAVADGMGGHAGGDVAARLAVDSLRAAFQSVPTVEGLRRAVAEANRAVWRQGQSQSGLRGMGTTLTATALVEEPGGRQVVALANVGDSRAYVYSRGQAIQVTADHSLAEEKVRQGQLTEAEAAVHPHRHVLTRALGVSSDVDVDLWELHLHDGDRILLCSDGLTNEVGDERIGEILGSVQDPSDAAKALVKAALDHGGSDNVTCVVIDVGDSAPPAAPAPAGEADATQPTAGREPDRTRGSGRPRTLRALSGGTTVAFAVGNGVGASAAKEGGRTAEHGRVASDGVRPGPGDGPASARLQAAELRRLQPSRDVRRGRRRVSGSPRLITVRLVLFVVLLLAVVGSGYVALRWYAMDEWYVGIDHGRLAVYQGRPGGFLWFKPRLVDESQVTTHEVLAYRLPQLRAHHQETSLAAAKSYMDNLHEEYLATRSLSAGRTPTAHSAHKAHEAHAPRSGKSGATPTSTGAFSVPVGVWQ
jgi:serine/threonine protein phosphatase PrpC